MDEIEILKQSIGDSIKKLGKLSVSVGKKVIEDAQIKAKVLENEAYDSLQELKNNRSEAEDILKKAEEQAKKILEEANSFKDASDTLLKETYSKKDIIIEDAEEEAKKILEKSSISQQQANEKLAEIRKLETQVKGTAILVEETLKHIRNSESYLSNRERAVSETETVLYKKELDTMGMVARGKSLVEGIIVLLNTVIGNIHTTEEIRDISLDSMFKTLQDSAIIYEEVGKVEDEILHNIKVEREFIQESTKKLNIREGWLKDREKTFTSSMEEKEKNFKDARREI